MSYWNVTILLFLSIFSVASFAAGKHLPGINEASVPLVPPPYPMVETPKQNAADQKLSESVKKELRAKLKNYNPESNMIVSQKGQIILQGKVSSPEEEKNILEVVSKMKGVTKIKNKMVVLAPPNKE